MLLETEEGTGARFRALSDVWEPLLRKEWVFAAVIVGVWAKSKAEAELPALNHLTASSV